MKSISQLKTEARSVLKGRWKEAVCMCLVPAVILVVFLAIFIIITILVAGSTGADASGEDSVSSLVSNAGSIVSGIVSTLFTVGFSWVFLDLLRGKKQKIHPLSDAFYGFQGKFVAGIIAIYFLTSMFAGLWSLLLIIPGIVKVYSYSQAYFIYYDTYEQTGIRPGFLDCITASRHLMKGYKGKLFLLDLSFIGWGILAGLTLGIGFLWLIPYIHITKAAFYGELVNKETQEPVLKQLITSVDN